MGSVALSLVPTWRGSEGGVGGHLDLLCWCAPTSAWPDWDPGYWLQYEWLVSHRNKGVHPSSSDLPPLLLPRINLLSPLGQKIKAVTEPLPMSVPGLAGGAGEAL